MKPLFLALALTSATSAFAAQPNYICKGLDYEAGDRNSELTYTVERQPGGRYAAINEDGDKTMLFPRGNGVWAYKYGGNAIDDTRLEVEANGAVTLYAPGDGYMAGTIAYGCVEKK